MSLFIKYAILRQLSYGKSYKEVGKFFAIPTNYISKLYKRYNLMKHIKQEPKYTKKMLNYIKEFVEYKPFVTCAEIAKVIRPKFNILISDKTVYNLLTKRLKFTYKKTTVHNLKRFEFSILVKRKEVLEELEWYKDNGWIIIFIDEVGFKSDYRPNKAWSPRGQRIKSEATRSQNYTVMSAMSAEFGLMGFMALKGGAKSEDYSGFMYELFTEWELANLDKNFLIFQDNASIHLLARYEIQTLKLKNLRVLYNAPYSPMIMAIEYYFNDWKRRFKKCIVHHEGQILKQCYNTACEITNKSVVGFVNAVFDQKNKINNFENMLKYKM